MNHEAARRSALIAQLEKKRALKEKYLRPREGAANPLTALVMTNALFLAIKERVDIFGLIRRLCVQSQANEAVTLDSALEWVQILADELGCSVYELFIEDRSKHRKQLARLLQELTDCDGWDNIQTARDGGGSFVLPGFDYAFRMSERPAAALVFEKTAVGHGGFRYTLTLGAAAHPMDPIPSEGVLWQETEGLLQQFTDRVLVDLNGGWPELKPVFDQVSRQLQTQAEALGDLALVLKEAPAGLNLAPLMNKTHAGLCALMEQAQAACDRMPEGMKAGSRGKQAQNMLILLGGALKMLERMIQSDGAEAELLDEVVYLLESAAAPVV